MAKDKRLAAGVVEREQRALHYPDPRDNTGQAARRRRLNPTDSRRLFPWVPRTINSTHILLNRRKCLGLLQSLPPVDGLTNTYVYLNRENSGCDGNHTRRMRALVSQDDKT